jgi:hypothetical protein
MNASRRPELAIAVSTHSSENPLGGQADVPFALNA